MNGYRRRSAIVAVALVATMSAGAALAADTGLSPGVVKTGLSSLGAGEATMANTLARQSLRVGIMTSTAYDTTRFSGTLGSSGIAAVGQALKQSDAAGVGAGAGYVSTLRDAMVDDGVTSAGFSTNRSGSVLADLTNLAQGLTGGASSGRETLANNGFGASGPSYANRGRLTGESGLLASARGSGLSGIELTQLADALTGSAERETLASSGLPTSSGSYARRGRLTDESGVSASFGNALLTSGASYAAPGRDNGAYGAAVANSRESGDPAAGLSQLAGALTSDRSDPASFAADPVSNGSVLRAGIAGATTSNAVYSSVLSVASSVDTARLAGVLAGN